MSRILLLIPLLLWMSWPHGDISGDLSAAAGAGLFLGLYVCLVLLMGVWARLLVRRTATTQLHRRITRFHRGMFVARMFVPAWLAVALLDLGWRDVVGNRLALDHLRFDLPSLLVGVAPCFMAWMGLWWSAWPVERALREHNILAQFDRDLPVHAPPGFWQFFWTNFRLQILFTLVPITLILSVVDLSNVAVQPLVGRISIEQIGWIQQAMILLAAGGIYILSPELLRRILRTTPLRDPVLRDRLLALAALHKLNVRDILLWQTHHNICNAAVMGILGRFRYVLLTDLLIETMSDEQIEAVFAHEVGHVVHRHMQWYVLIIGTLMLGTAGLGQGIERAVGPTHLLQWAGLSLDAWLTLFGAVTFLITFGFLSRRFERQADVFAARTMESRRAPATAVATTRVTKTVVGPYGASVFASALYRVASVNNIPAGAPRWTGGGLRKWLLFVADRLMDHANHFLHGSISRRSDYLQTLAQNPGSTHRFDRFMSRLYRTLLITFAASVLFAFYPQLLR